MGARVPADRLWNAEKQASPMRSASRSGGSTTPPVGLISLAVVNANRNDAPTAIAWRCILSSRFHPVMDPSHDIDGKRDLRRRTAVMADVAKLAGVSHQTVSR